ncbi:MAG TPA: peptidoglycan-associated lipoprotein Pal [Bdellovibrionota bacterium]|nr:peptidoglycan-associated lipoprotein Pal [Bdellovibrionota bacterium]
MKRFWIMTVALTMFGMLAGGCAGKKTETGAAGAGGPGGGDTSGISESGAGSTGGAGSASGVPVVYFDFDQYTLNNTAQSELKDAAGIFKSDPKMAITIEGHCDERGSVEYNLALGERRAQSVKSYLQKLGIETKRLNTISYGEERPATSGSGESSWAKNRRAELIKNR